MKYIGLLVSVLCVYLSIGEVVIGQSNVETQMEVEKLQVSTELIEQIYCDDQINGDVFNVRLKLLVHYKNSSDSNLILYKGDEASFFNTMVSFNQENASARKYEYSTQACSIISPKKFLSESKPGKDFIILKGGEVFTKQSTVLLLIPKTGITTVDSLKSGNYVLQIATSTWPGTNQQKNALKHKWKKDGFLYTFNIESLPMEFSIVDNPSVIDCPAWH